MTRIISSLLIALCFSSCAETVFYDRNGQMIAKFQGDMTNVEFHYTGNGSITWRAATVSHSAATSAAYAGVGAAVGAAGAAVVSAKAIW